MCFLVVQTKSHLQMLFLRQNDRFIYVKHLFYHTENMCKIYLFIWPSSVTDMELVACFWVFSSKISFVFSKIFLMESNFGKVIQGLVLGIKMGLFFSRNYRQVS